jgi:hypothetical protein
VVWFVRKCCSEDKVRAVDQFLYTLLFVWGKTRKKLKIRNKHAKVTRNSTFGIAIGYGLNGRGVGVKSPGKGKIFVSTSFRTVLGPTQPPIHLIPGGSGVKRSGCEVDDSPTGVEVKNGRAIRPLPRTSSWLSVYLIKLRHNFTFYRLIWRLKKHVKLKVNRHFGGTCCLHLQGRRINQARNHHEAVLVSCLACSSNLNMEATFFFRNVGWLSTGYTALYPRRQYSS